MAASDKPKTVWSDDEADSAIAFIRAEEPDLLERWRCLEEGSADLSEGGIQGSVGNRISQLLARAHPDVSPIDRIFLKMSVRGRFRRLLGLE